MPTPYYAIRTAQSMLVGNDWPPIAWTETGMAGDGDSAGRADSCCLLLDAAGDTEAMPVGVRRRLLRDPDAPRWLLAWVLERAQWYAGLDEDAAFAEQCLPATEDALRAGTAEVAGLVAAARNKQAAITGKGDMDAKVALLLGRLVYTGDHDQHWIAKADLKEALGLKPKQDDAALRAAMAKMAGEQLQHTKKGKPQVWCWTGWQWSDGTDALPDGPMGFEMGGDDDE